MAMMLDLIGSVVLAGFVILMGLRMNANLANSGGSYKADVVVQENLVSLVESIEYDFRKMGYGVSDPTKVILRADSNAITFRGDIDDNGVVDTVEWYLGGLVGSTPNPSDRILYRRIHPTSSGGTSLAGALPGVTVFNLKYLNHESLPPTGLGQIWIVETTLRVESPWRVQNRSIDEQEYGLWAYSAAFWRQTRLASRNLKRHG
jgi:hypothetical protein